MAGWTKEDFDTKYSCGVEGSMGGHSNIRPEVRLHYHRGIIKPQLEEYWKNLVPSVYDIKSTDTVVIVGAAFGWGVEALIALTGANVTGVDISDWIASAQNTSEESEIDACITLAGLDPTQGRGLEIKNKYYIPGPRCTTTILNDDIQNVVNEYNPDWMIEESIS